MRKVYFLGAGASKAFGFPVTSELFPLILSRLNQGMLYPESEELANVYMEEFKVLLEALFPGALNPSIIPPSIAYVLSLVDQFLLMRNPPCPKVNLEKLGRFRLLLTRALLEVIGQPSDKAKWERTQPLFIRFSEWLKQAKSKYHTEISIVTTNYDIILEKTMNPLWTSSLDFGVSWRDPRSEQVSIKQRPGNPQLSIFKLHGSANWLKCPLCEHIYINVFGAVYHQAFREDIDQFNTCHCGYAPLQPLIIAPSLIQDIHDVNLLSIWQSTLETMRVADEWVIIGYSLPPEDIAIQSIFLRAYRGKEIPPNITVIQESGNLDVESRYRFLFPECIYNRNGFEEYINLLPQ